jgi:hypothetical protein
MKTEKEIQGTWKDVIYKTPFKITNTICYYLIVLFLLILVVIETYYKDYKAWVLSDE